ncbi:7-carboxy-7-deazaguanine synthase QueE [Desulfosporosinus sp. BICA1-9]|uniref:7-carboxy-7-deazaguanine synthase QueE n=1 Tax=Desulfosporosinus sp. BICA1-9 TaxID=1531958 RepID=UPI00054BF250|nr:7-carboxy-7-deazaguanine synthase QueE [Desulfosporosinus sp. BICA1-9]KJS49075.1 MAG: radical SAM protein [Peptococcaceae bacterium BRH_c23]KJS88891.1 MAG: radical SAM protein [Desulfosporosinus sp. BICA1-9]HBW36688.1 7-carboxy-7-deazaguanine synthase QueE [Desulfosporosinus sp.]
MLKLPITEIFSSIQGEGPYVGVRQIFLRLPNCNLNCPYCDTNTSIPPQFRMEADSGTQLFKQFDNPVPIDKLLALIETYDVNLHHSLSITGGEPLLWVKELKVLLPLLRDKGFKIYLETNGTLPEQLLEVLPWVDIISMDIKLPFDGQVFWDVHEFFLRYSLQKEVFIKLVVQEDTSLINLHIARDLIARVDPLIQTILQPVTPTHGIKAPKPDQLLKWQSFFLEKLRNIRVIPQTHVFMGQL